MNPTPLLDTIDLPQDVRRLQKTQLPKLADELRSYLLESVSKTGGHFASNLGAIELTVALHYVYQTPYDHLIWDVGHQSYPHKILTGRKQRMNTMRQCGGLAGFPKRSESEYDVFGVGHSSTSIGAALGMAVADKLQHKTNRSVAIIGDGAMTAGQAFEALNNAGDMDIDLLVILNDNEMSISPNVGALPKYLAKNPLHDVKDLVKSIKHKSEKVLSLVPGALDVAQRVENKIKGLIEESSSSETLSLFDNFGFTYSGPVDGHDVIQLVDVLQEMRSRKGPQLLHIITKKGHGYKLAENDPVAFHAVSAFDPQQGLHSSAGAAKPTYTQIFSQWIIDQAAADNKLLAITPAMREGSGLVEFEKLYPERYFDVGIAEQHAVTFAAGLACEQMKPVVAIYSTFLQRAYDQLIHDVALQNLPVLFAIDRGGIVGADGPTHAGVYDLSYLRCVPNLVIAVPSDERECRLLLSSCYQLNQPAAVRYPRGTGTGIEAGSDLSTVAIGKGVVRHKGSKIALVAFGSMVQPALTVANAIDATVADMRFVKPLDTELLVQLAAEHDYIVTLEENSKIGGAGSAVLEALVQHNLTKPVLTLGIPDIVTEHGDTARLLAQMGLSAEKIQQQILQWIE
ncbi:MULTISPECIES: 1-deoxy-D-xylulose-5-phosphate synthase [unclassified Snodgrassella]|uniref:1-deoxy-D-xylulose-5-phosphate synthase n=1 Tax=unclassified Snodgrassella TaxID=2625236 RepID=UPI0018DDF376|nr:MULTISPECIES: 1-deoxy-D-xylulose-5-phosphate synthase [unclassified Snodgrassella]MBI0097977.1 1-deoxy-D-xylulose-5-phosphate synthase [Snodgrassella sp. W8134]MBI0101767.1 1-deoxy-D-xylulose-5-phosphate synthase [Snodgrassella sp. W8135]